MNYIIDPAGKVVDAWYGGGRDHPKAVAAIKKIGGPLAEAIRKEEQKKTLLDPDWLKQLIDKVR